MIDKKILIVDDDPDILESLRLMLSLKNYEVETLSKGQEEFKTNFQPDLFLLDVWLSGEDGRDICKKLKTTPETQNIPVIMISASHALKNSVLEVGADAFIPKPFEMETLLGVINELI